MTRHQSGVQGAFVTSYSPEPEPQTDTSPSDMQPPGVDEEDDDFPQSLEEALTG
tara:strand:- start:45 stop:206 length:162 start_codon:yes stop_codon:yes gene_type:complete